MLQRLLALVPFSTFLGAAASSAPPMQPMHPIQAFALLAGGLASLTVGAYHVAKILRNK